MAAFARSRRLEPLACVWAMGDSGYKWRAWRTIALLLASAPVACCCGFPRPLLHLSTIGSLAGDLPVVAPLVLDPLSARIAAACVGPLGRARRSLKLLMAGGGVTCGDGGIETLWRLLSRFVRSSAR